MIAQGDVRWAETNVSQLLALDRGRLEQAVSRLSRAKIDLLLSGIDVVLGR